MMIPAIDQHIADAGGAHFAEGDFLRVVGGHGRIIKNPAPPREFRRMAKELVGTIAAASRIGWRRRRFRRRQGRPWP